MHSSKHRISGQKGEKSPYAQPLHIISSTSAIDARRHAALSQTRSKQGRIVIRVRMPKKYQETERGFSGNPVS